MLSYIADTLIGLLQKMWLAFALQKFDVTQGMQGIAENNT